MTNAESVKKYHAKLFEFKVRPRKEEAEEIKKAAERLGMSVQTLFLEAVREYIAQRSEAQQPQNDRRKRKMNNYS